MRSSTPSPTVDNLTQADFATLARSYVTPDLARRANIYRVDSPDGAEIVCRKPTASKDYAGIVFPYYWPGETHPREYRLRRDNPDLERKSDGSIKEKEKYLSPRGRGNILYFPPDTPVEYLTDVTIPAVITEGEKKGLALSRYFGERSEGRLIVGLTGVWCWRGKVGQTTNGRGKRQPVSGVISDFDRIEWTGREVWIVFDVNVATDDSVSAARRELAKELTRRGAVVRTLDLPGDVAGVNGVDDLLAIKGADFVAALFAEADDGLSADDEPYTGFYRSLKELHDKVTEPADYVLVGVRRRQVTLFLSVTNVGKTTTLLNHSLAAAAARVWNPLLPEAPARPLKVIYIDGESTDDELKQDTRTMLGSIGGADKALINFIPVVEASIRGESLDLANKEHFVFVKNLIRQERPDIVVIDTIGSLFTLFNENDNAEVKRRVIRPLKELAAVGNCGVIASHHIGKRGENTADEEEAYLGRGASAFGCESRAVFTLRKEKALGEGYVRLTLTKAKGVKFDPVNLRLDFDRRTFEICAAAAPRAETPYQRVIGVFNGQPLKTKEIKELLPNLAGRTVDKVLKTAVKNGDLLKTELGTYQKHVQNPTSHTSHSLIGNAKCAKSGQTIDSTGDTFDFAEWDEKGPCEVDQGKLLEPNGLGEDAILDAIDR